MFLCLEISGGRSSINLNREKGICTIKRGGEDRDKEVKATFLPLLSMPAFENESTGARHEQPYFRPPDIAPHQRLPTPRRSATDANVRGCQVRGAVCKVQAAGDRRWKGG